MAHRVNQEVAGRLEEAARLLRDQGADLYRVNAYRRAAMTVRGRAEPVDQIFRHKGLDGLKELRGVGDTIARAIRELLVHGRLPMLDRLRGESDPVSLLASVPGIGGILAERLHDELGLETLADLEAAAHDGRLDTIAGFGEKSWRHGSAVLRIDGAARCASGDLSGTYAPQGMTGPVVLRNGAADRRRAS